MKGHIGIQRTIREFRRKYYFPGFIEFLIQYINNCLTCFQAKSPNHQALHFQLSPVSSNTSMPADMLQIDVVGPLPKSGGFSYILTGMDVFTKYVCPTSHFNFRRNSMQIPNAVVYATFIYTHFSID